MDLCVKTKTTQIWVVAGVDKISKSYKRKLYVSMKKNEHVMCTTFVEVITQYSANQGGSTVLPFLQINLEKPVRRIMYIILY